MFSHKSENNLAKKVSTGSTLNLKCRGCLAKEPDMNFLFLNYKNIATLAKIIEETIGYVITEEERFSEYLCKECTRTVVDFIIFKRTFQEATEYFKSLSFSSESIQNTKELNLQNVNNGSYDSNVTTKIKNLEENSLHNDKTNSNEKDFKNLGQFDNSTECIYEKTPKLSQEPKKEVELKCDLCSELFKSKIKLQRHKKTIHKNTFPPNRVKKKNIGESSSEKLSPNNLDIPLINTDFFDENLTNTEAKKFCKVCKNTYSVEEFEIHFETHKSHICNTCGHKFIRKTDLNDHEETHLEICKYICQHCGKAFKVRTALNKHKRIHTNPREEICDVCGQRFNTRDTLKTHYKLKHIKSKDFQCNLCGLAFTLKSTLEKHIERHNPNRQRIYSCNLCSVSYINKYNLSRHHIIKHTAFESRPTCTFCGKGYTKKVDLIKHLKKHHDQQQRDNQDGNKKGSELDNF